MSDPKPEISAIVIVFNGRQFLPELLATLRENLSFTPHELILVDNGSVDGSVEYINEHHPEALLVENGANLGFAKAVNIGLQRARGDFLYVLNQDLRFRPGATQRLLERLKSEPQLGMIGPGYVYFDGVPHKSVRALPKYRHVIYRALLLDRFFPRHREFSHWRMGWFDHKTEMYVDQPMGAVMLIPRPVVERVGMMDEAFPILFNDVDYCHRMKTGRVSAPVLSSGGGRASRRRFDQQVPLPNEDHLALVHVPIPAQVRPVVRVPDALVVWIVVAVGVGDFADGRLRAPSAYFRKIIFLTAVSVAVSIR